MQIINAKPKELIFEEEINLVTSVTDSAAADFNIQYTVPLGKIFIPHNLDARLNSQGTTPVEVEINGIIEYAVIGNAGNLYFFEGGLRRNLGPASATMVIGQLGDKKYRAGTTFKVRGQRVGTSSTPTQRRVRINGYLYREG